MAKHIQPSTQPILLALILLGLSALACSLGGQPSVVTPLAAVDTTPTRIVGGGVPATATPTITPSATPTHTPTPTHTLTPTPTFTPTPSPTPTNTPTSTPGVMTLTPIPTLEEQPLVLATVEAPLMPTAGWSCEDFPCEDDIEGFLGRIGVPQGFAVSHVGQLPGQPVSITFGPDGRLYAAVITDGAQAGAIVAMDPATGQSDTVLDGLISPGGLAFRPGTDILYYTGRTASMSGGAIWSLQPGDPPRLLRDDLPCCFTIINGQPNGLIFGPDGSLLVATGALTDHTEAAPNLPELYATPTRWEGAVLRLPPDGSSVEVLGRGFRDPIDLAFTADGRLFVTDTGLIIGVGDRLMRLVEGAHHGWPYWRERGCLECPVIPPDLTPVPDYVTLPGDSSPRGIVAYHGTQFPAEYYDNLFVALWNGVPGAQRIIRVRNLPNDQARISAFVTGLIRPADVAVAPDGTLVVADYIYGHVWRVRYTGE
ncbi:MAG: hypothetical protein Kow0077_22280 [Anaerolineae bacterium]